MSSRDYGVTTSALLANQQARFEAKLRTCADKNFELAGRLAREQELRARLERFLEEKGYLDQWQNSDSDEAGARGSPGRRGGP